jgi:hypothetical protein
VLEIDVVLELLEESGPMLGVLELVVVLELLEESGPNGDVVLVVEVVPEIVVVTPGKVVVVPLGQPLLGAGIMSSLWSPWPKRPLASTVIFA